MYKVVTNKFRAAFANVFKPNEDDKYQVTMVFDSEADVANLKKAIKEWAEEEGIPLKGLAMPFKSGTEKADKDDKYEDFRGKILITPVTWNQPGLVNQKREPILDENDFYSGCYARASITPRLWVYQKTKGIGFFLNNVQKMADGERYGGSFNPADDFETVETTESLDDDFNI